MSASSAVPIAIIGIGCRFPGGVESPEGLWNLAAAGRQTVGPVPPDRWDVARLAAIHDPDIAIRAGRGCFLDGDVWAWDPAAFSVAPLEQDAIDPQFRLLLEVAWEAVEHAGIPMERIRGSRTGVYMGTYAPDNLFRDARPVEDAPDSPYLFGNYTAGAAGRVGFAMDLRGPVMVVSSHCSSGLVAVDTACAALTLGECDAALAGAVLLMLAPQTQYQEAPLLLSRRGGCYAFDARADGYVRGEGAGVLLLKRLEDARRDGDRVLAVVRGAAVNNDGQATRLTAPSTDLQQQLFRDAVHRAAIDPGTVGLVEAHGPGTAVGDPIEYTSIDAVYGRGVGGCALGSVKTNIGHCEPVSGVAGTIKAVESLRRGLIPPNLNFRDWNPTIPRTVESRLFVPTRLTAWPVPDGPRLAAVCSYGVSGTNAHLILEAPPPARRGSATRGGRDAALRRQWLFPLSGGSPPSLQLAATRLADWLDSENTAADLADVAHTLSVRRSHGTHRLCVVARDRDQLTARVRGFAVGDEPPGVVSGVVTLPPEHAGPVLVFTGQGSQRAGMCQGLLADEPVFAEVIGELEPLIRAAAGFSLRAVLGNPRLLVGLDRIQPTLFGVQVALAALWRSWGIRPTAVIGQSLGEVAAGVVAGALSLADGVKIICRRSALLATLSGGAMASVLLGADEVRATLRRAGADGVELGVLTSPGGTVISGDARQVSGMVRDWNAAGVPARMVDVEVASHSPQVDPILDALREALADIPASTPQITVFSTTSSDPQRPGLLDAGYWVRNQRDPVRFHPAVSAALAQGHRVFLECSPHPLAVRAVLDTAQCDGVPDAVAVGTLRQGVPDREAFLTELGTLHCAGYDGIDWGTHQDGELAAVPGTAWHRVRHGGQPPYRLVSPSLVSADQHPLLGGHVHDPDRPDRHLWQTPIGPNRLPWLADHAVAGTPVLPGTGFAEMAISAGAAVFGTDRVRVTELTAVRPLVLVPEPVVTVRLIRHGDQAEVEVLSDTEEGFIVHATATVGPLIDPTPEPVQAATAGWTDRAPEDLYHWLRDRQNVRHGPAFAGLDQILIDPGRDRAVASVRITDAARRSASTMALHPALADELVQTAVSAWLAHHAVSPGPVVVAGCDDICVYGPTAHARLAIAELHHADEQGCVAAAILCTVDGGVLAELRGLRLTNITPPAQRFAARLTHLKWEPVSRARAATGGGRLLLLADDQLGWPAGLVRALSRRGADCEPRQELPAGAGGPYSAVLLITGQAPGEPPTAARADVARAIALIRWLAERPERPRLWVIGTGDTPSGLRGLLRTAGYEHPDLLASYLDVGPDTTPDAVIDDLLDDDLPISEISWRDGRRRIARLRAGGDIEANEPAPAQDSPIRAGHAYLVTGGLGGLGMRTATWLADRGAGLVVLNGRSAPSPEITLPDRAVLVPGDIADPAVADHAVATATAHGHRLAGVVHAAGVVEDATIGNLGQQLLDRVWRGKVDGAWALHHATTGHDVDFFVLYSSMAALLGSPGQAAYAAANAFLDELADYRLARGLPVTAIDWGGWGKIGRGQHLTDRGFQLITPDDGVDALERILRAGYHRVGYSPLDPDRWTAPYPALRNSALLAELVHDTSDQSDDAGIRAELVAADNEPARQRILRTFIIDQVRDILGGTSRHIGPHTSMVLLGVDSLGAVQLQQRLQHALKIDITSGVIWVKPSAASLGDWLLSQLSLDVPDTIREGSTR